MHINVLQFILKRYGNEQVLKNTYWGEHNKFGYVLVKDQFGLVLHTITHTMIIVEHMYTNTTPIQTFSENMP